MAVRSCFLCSLGAPALPVGGVGVRDRASPGCAVIARGLLLSGRAAPACQPQPYRLPHLLAQCRPSVVPGRQRGRAPPTRLGGRPFRLSGSGRWARWACSRLLVAGLKSGKGRQARALWRAGCRPSSRRCVKVGRQQRQPQVQITVELRGRKHGQRGRQGQHIGLQLRSGGMGVQTAHPCSQWPLCPHAVRWRCQAQGGCPTGRAKQQCRSTFPHP
jgi:hypothetical protein